MYNLHNTSIRMYVGSRYLFKFIAYYVIIYYYFVTCVFII